MSVGRGPWARLVSDEQLVTRLRRGDSRAFEQLYDRHSAELLSFSCYMLGSRDDAEDAVQTTFASAYRALLADERPIDVRPWLFAIVRNTSLSILRQRRRTTELSHPPADRADTLTKVEQRADIDQLLSTMLELPERQRAALLLAELHGLTQREIGSLLGIRADQVKACIHQARSSLISERAARATDCQQIRSQLSTARGAALLKANLRRHVRACPGCRTYAASLSAHRRRQFGILIPIAPSLALKRRALEATLGEAPGGWAGGTIGASMAGGATQLVGDGVRAMVGKLVAAVAALGGASSSVGALLVGGTLLIGAAPAQPQSAPTHGRHVQSAVAQLQAGRSGLVPEWSPTGDRAPSGSADGHGNPPATPIVPNDASRLSADQHETPLAADAQPSPGHNDSSAASTAHGRSATSASSDAGAHGASTSSHGGRVTHGNGSVTHGNSQSAPGRSEAAHGNSAAAPGHSGGSHGNSASAPGHSAVAGARGHSASVPGHSDTTQSDNASTPEHGAPGHDAGQSAACHGNRANTCNEDTAPTSSPQSESAARAGEARGAESADDNNDAGQADAQHGQSANGGGQRGGDGSPRQ